MADKIINEYDMESKGFEQSVNKIKAGYDTLLKKQLALKKEVQAYAREEKRLSDLQASGQKVNARA